MHSLAFEYSDHVRVTKWFQTHSTDRMLRLVLRLSKAGDDRYGKGKGRREC